MSLNGARMMPDGAGIALYDQERVFYSVEGVSLDFESGGYVLFASFVFKTELHLTPFLPCFLLYKSSL
jgi:hypothetical protein